MNSAGKRTNTEGTARGAKRRLEEEAVKEPYKKPKLDESESDLTSLDSSELNKIVGEREDSPQSSKKQEESEKEPSQEHNLEQEKSEGETSQETRTDSFESEGDSSSVSSGEEIRRIIAEAAEFSPHSSDESLSLTDSSDQGSGQGDQSQPFQPGPSQPGPSQPIPMGPPPHPLGDSPPSLVGSGESAGEDNIPEGLGIPPDDRDD